jgi:hypothetical protein
MVNGLFRSREPAESSRIGTLRRRRSNRTNPWLFGRFCRCSGNRTPLVYFTVPVGETHSFGIVAQIRR